MAVTGLRIAQVANFYGPESGGLRTTVDMLGRGYSAAGFDRVLVVPGTDDVDEQTPAGRRITLRAPAVPGGGGYRFFPDWRRVAKVLEEVDIDRLEVSDKLTLWPLGGWATRQGIPAVLLSHERLDAIFSPRLPSWAPPGALAKAAEAWNRRLATSFPTIVAASAFSCQEWQRIGVDTVLRVPLGVDLETFVPHRAGPEAAQAELVCRRAGPEAAQAELVCRRSGPEAAQAELVCLGRLSREKRPDLAVRTLAELVDGGVAARLTMVGAGPEADRLASWCRQRGLPVRFLGHVSDRRALADLLAGADAVLAPCPVEAFGLAVLEALACGTPVVTADQGAAPELVAAGCGASAPPRPLDFAAATARLLQGPRRWSRAAARRRAEQFPWSTTVAAMLAAHRLGAPVAVGPSSAEVAGRLGAPPEVA